MWDKLDIMLYVDYLILVGRKILLCLFDVIYFIIFILILNKIKFYVLKLMFVL